MKIEPTLHGGDSIDLDIIRGVLTENVKVARLAYEAANFCVTKAIAEHQEYDREAMLRVHEDCDQARQGYVKAQEAIVALDAASDALAKGFGYSARGDFHAAEVHFLDSQAKVRESATALSAFANYVPTSPFIEPVLGKVQYRFDPAVGRNATPIDADAYATGIHVFSKWMGRFSEKIGSVRTMLRAAVADKVDSINDAIESVRIQLMGKRDLFLEKMQGAGERATVAKKEISDQAWIVLCRASVAKDQVERRFVELLEESKQKSARIAGGTVALARYGVSIGDRLRGIGRRISTVYHEGAAERSTPRPKT